VRRLVLAALACLALARPAWAQDGAFRDIIVPVGDGQGVDSRLRALARENGALILAAPDISDRYRVVRTPLVRADDVYSRIDSWYDDFRYMPIDVANYRTLIGPAEAPAFGTQARADLDAMTRAFGERNVEFSRAVPLSVYGPEAAGLDITILGETYTVDDAIGRVMRLRSRRSGEAAVLYNRPVEIDGATMLESDIVQGDDITRITPIDRTGGAYVLRLRNAAAIPDHAPLSAEQTERMQTAQRRRSAAPTPANELPGAETMLGEGCETTDPNTLVLGWVATTTAWTALSARGFSRLEDEVEDLRDALTANGVAGSVKLFPLLKAAQTWQAQDVSTQAVVDIVAGDDPRGVMTPFWRAANAGCADILVMITDIPLGSTAAINADCGAGVVFATARTAAVVLNQQCLLGVRHALAHEIGHVFGGCHEYVWYENGNPPCSRVDVSLAFERRYAWTGQGTINNAPVPAGDIMASWASRQVDRNFLRNVFYSEPLKFGVDATNRMNVGELVRQRFFEVAQFYEHRVRRGSTNSSS
jgi:hypothetical protein